MFIFMLQVQQAYNQAQTCDTALKDFTFSSESLEKLCKVLENIFQFKLCVTDANDLNRICLAVQVCFSAIIYFKIILYVKI